MYTGEKIKLPHPDEVPHLDMQVVNFHRPIFGTFHSKYVVVDRKIAILQSNNIQDNDNMEMMIHVEGPIVDSFYDAALVSWHNELKPPLPTAKFPASESKIPPAFHSEWKTGQDLEKTMPKHTPEDPHYDPDISAEAYRMQCVLNPLPGESRMNAVTRLFSELSTTSVLPLNKANRV